MRYRVGMESVDITLFLAGDVMTGRGIDQILPHPSNPELHQNNRRSATDYVSGILCSQRPVAFSYPWGEGAAVWQRRNHDVGIVNLETAVTTSDRLLG